MLECQAYNAHCVVSSAVINNRGCQVDNLVNAASTTRGACKFLLLCIGLATLLGGCDKPRAPQARQPEVTVITVEPKDTPVTFEFVGSRPARNRSRCGRGSTASWTNASTSRATSSSRARLCSGWTPSPSGTARRLPERACRAAGKAVDLAGQSEKGQAAGRGQRTEQERTG